MNASISEDHKLLVRTAVKGDMTWTLSARNWWRSAASCTSVSPKAEDFTVARASSRSAFKGHGKGVYHVTGKGWNLTTPMGSTMRRTAEPALQSFQISAACSADSMSFSSKPSSTIAWKDWVIFILVELGRVLR